MEWSPSSQPGIAGPVPSTSIPLLPFPFSRPPIIQNPQCIFCRCKMVLADKALPIGRTALDLLPRFEKAGVLPAQRLGQLLSRTAFELRRIVREGNVQNGNVAAIQRGGNADTIWLRIRLLVEFGCVEDARLSAWLPEMGRALFACGGVELLVDRLEWLCLALNAHCLPAICKPSPAFLLDKNYRTKSAQTPSFSAFAEAAARIDIAGGWTDTPPITYQMGSELPAVLSMAVRVNGRLPIRCQCSRLATFEGIFYREKSAGQQQQLLHFPMAAQVFANSSRPSAPGSLLCAVLVIARVVREELRSGKRRQFFDFNGMGRGILVETESDLPHGSGLGSSSILSAALLAAFSHLQGRQLGHSQLLHSVLRVEQLHSTGGGWQDQMGGCLPGGLKLGWVQPDGERQCHWRAVPLGGQLREELGQRLVLVYTGKTRLAKTLLQEVLLSWSRGDAAILETVQRLAQGARRAEKEMREGKFPSDCCAEYNELKKRFAHNTEPPVVTELKEKLMRRQLAEVAWMAGAGGGGFLYVWLAQGVNAAQLEEMLATDCQWYGMSLWRVDLEEHEPLAVR